MHLLSHNTAIMSIMLLSQRETTQKVKENEKIFRFHAVVDDIETTLINIDDFPGACSDK